MVESDQSLLMAQKYMPYMNEFQMKIPELSFGEEVFGDTSVIIIANKNLRSNAFGLRDVDKSPFAGVIPPGKSAHIYFRGDPQQVCEIVLNRKFIPERDEIYVSTAGELSQIGFLSVWAPLRRCPLHLRVVHKSAYGVDPKEYSSYQVSIDAREELVDLLSQRRLRVKSGVIFE